MAESIQYGLKWATGRITPTTQDPETLVFKYTRTDVTVVVREIDPTSCCPGTAGEWQCWAVPCGTKN